MAFILGLFDGCLQVFRITLRTSFRWKLMEKFFQFMASENRCTVMYTIEFLEKLFVNCINI